MKAYTDLGQSKKLADILPLESADMYWWFSGKRYYIEAMDNGDFNEEGDVRAWSLGALLDVIPYVTVNDDGEDLRFHMDKYCSCYCLFYENEYTGDMNVFETDMYDNMVDACYDIIIKLKENNLL